MTIFSVENLSKSYGLVPLFDDITFGLSKGDKVGLVAPNGSGKSSLFRIIAGKDRPDNGQVILRNGLRTSWLEQEPALKEGDTIREYVLNARSKAALAVQQFEQAVSAQSHHNSENNRLAFEKALVQMEAAGGWNYEKRMEAILDRLGITEWQRVVGTLSGGEKKRLALAACLLEEPDLLLLDEPTNHMDLEMIEWLEVWLQRSTLTLLMITHDRYFLDRVCHQIIELDQSKLHVHKGNYNYYLIKKAERLEIDQVQQNKLVQLYKKELDWMRRSPKARTTKSQSRMDAFFKTEKKARNMRKDPAMRLEVQATRMGGKILELENLSKRFEDRIILDQFSYVFQRGERIGIIGNNGSGKSTFLKILTGEEPADKGRIDWGTTMIFGHYRQEGALFDENQRVVDVIREIAEYITLADGNRISASQFLEHFMFTGNMQYAPIGKLSGGERRRLALMTVLIRNPNFLILDEPTNDLDLVTLNKLEEFLLNFEGCLLVVSHDRFFLDKMVQHLFLFEGNGVIRDINCTYSEYREQKQIREEKENEKPAKTLTEEKVRSDRRREKKPNKKNQQLSYKERNELEQLEKEMEILGAEKHQVETDMNQTALCLERISELSQRYLELSNLMETKEARWLELAERASMPPS